MDNKSSSSRFGDLVKFLSTVKGDLANLTAPPSFLAPSSVVENPRSWAEFPALFTAPATEQDPRKRSLLVLQIFLAGLRSQLYVAGAPDISIKKPLNAFLGELFLASWTDNNCDATTKLVVEQVSHHPPITAVHISSKDHGIRADGYARVEMKFSGTINIKQIGHSMIHIDKFDEDYLLPLPDVQVRGLLSRCFYPEIIGVYKIISSTGYISEVKFSGLGVLGGGEKNHFEARVYHKTKPKTSIYTVAGVWSEGWTIKDGQTGEILEVYDVNGAENLPAPMNIESVEDQDPWESQRAWREVISPLKEGDLGVASRAKHKIEESQRRMREAEKVRDEQWNPLLFHSIPGDEHEAFHRITGGTNWELSDGETKGVWRVNESRLDTLKKPYRGSITPLG